MVPARVQTLGGGGVIFREFVTETLDAVRMLAGGVQGGRDITPMVHLETPDGRRELVAVDPLFFTEDDGVGELVDRFVVPLVREREATKVAWTFTATWGAQQLSPTLKVGSIRIVTAVIIDREVHETWLAPIFDGPRVGDWLNLGANSTDGLMVGPVQEALR